MRENLQRAPRPNEADQTLVLFLADMNELSRRHGIGITGDMTLFIMERDDYERQYTADTESRLEFV